MSGACIRLSWFISISYSKSEIARRPFTIARAPTRCANSTMSTSNDAERTLPIGLVASSMKPSRSSVENSVLPLRTGWLTIATTTSSNIAEARPMTSRCPFVIGSYEPGQTAMRGSGVMGVDADERVAVAAFVRDREEKLDRGAAVALRHHAAAGRKQRPERRGELPPQLRCAPVRGVDEDQIVCVSAGGCVAQRRARGPGLHAGLGLAQPERAQVGPDHGHRARIAVDQHGAPRPPRQGLDRQRAGPGVEVQHARAVERPQDREHRLADAVRRRPGAVAGRRRQAPAAEPAGYDAHARRALTPPPPRARPRRARPPAARARAPRAPGPRAGAPPRGRAPARAPRRRRVGARSGSAPARTGAFRTARPRRAARGRS